MVTSEVYEEMGRVHTVKDREVGEIEVEQIQSELNGHVATWLKMFAVGEYWGHQDRVRESMVRKSCEVRKMSLLVKDHKPVKPGSLPGTRPVVAACTGTNVPLSDLICDLIEPGLERQQEFSRSDIK